MSAGPMPVAGVRDAPVGGGSDAVDGAQAPRKDEVVAGPGERRIKSHLVRRALHDAEKSRVPLLVKAHGADIPFGEGVAEAAAADASAHALDGGGEFVEGLIPVLKQMEGGALGRPGAVARKFSEGLDQTLDGWGKTDAHGLGFAGEKLILMSAGLPK